MSRLPYTQVPTHGQIVLVTRGASGTLVEIGWDNVENISYLSPSGTWLTGRPKVIRIDQACMLADRIQIDASSYSEVPSGACSVIFVSAPIETIGISLPISSLPVSVSGIGSVSIVQDYGGTATPSPTASATGSPTATSTPTRTGTPTCACTGGSPTPTCTLTPTSTPIFCSTTTVWGDSTAGGGTVSPTGTTQAQEYALAQGATVKKIWVQMAAPATLKVGIYSGTPSSLWPGDLLYGSDYQPMTIGLNSVAVPDVTLNAGTYWLAYGVQGASPVTLQAAANSTTLHAYLPTDFSCHWLSCGYAPCNAPTATPMGPSSPTPTPTILCTPPPFGIASNQGVIYAEVCR